MFFIENIKHFKFILKDNPVEKRKRYRIYIPSYKAFTKKINKGLGKHCLKLYNINPTSFCHLRLPLTPKSDQHLSWKTCQIYCLLVNTQIHLNIK